MAMRCFHCNKGILKGHNVSHAKNRTRRFFEPNLQSLKVLVTGIPTRIRMCTRCIKRLHKDGRIGVFSVLKQKTLVKPAEKKAIEIKKVMEKPVEKNKDSAVKKKALIEKLTEVSKPAKTLDISSIVGKKI